MIRPFTLLTMLLAAISGAYLFAVKHRAQGLDDQLASVAQQTREDQQRVQVLQAQWALETDPTRLGQLAARFTKLQPMKPQQLISLASLGDVLPPPGNGPGVNNPAMPAAQDLAANVPPAPVVAMPAPMVVASAASSVSDAPAQAMVPSDQSIAAMSAAREPPPKKQITARAHTQQRVAVRQSHPAMHEASSLYAEALPPPRPLPQAGSAYMPVAQFVPVKAYAQQALSESGSALTMGADLAPPQPLSADNSN